MGSVYIRPVDTPRGDQTTAGRFAISRWGGPTQSKITTTTVGTTATRIILNNPRRVRLLIMNFGTSDITVGFDSSVTTTTGIKVVASTGYMESNANDDGEEVLTEFWAISSAAGNNVIISEVFRV